MTLDVTLRPVGDWNALGKRWRDFEGRAGASFFQSWSWVGCLAEERFDRPVLLEARQDGQTVALALFNLRPGRLHDRLLLHETGDPGWDALFIEYNGILIDPAVAEPTLAACLATALRDPLPGSRGLLGRRLVLSGIDAAQLAAARAAGTVRGEQVRQAPYVDLAALRRRGEGHLAPLSANTRAQLRRTLRLYQAAGPLRVACAETPAAAHAALDALAALHQAAWQRRGKPGAFADPRFGRFHHALIDRLLPRGELELLRVSAGQETVGYLYNFRQHGHVMAYQSGFHYAGALRHQKPGLTCHHLAIERNLAEGMDVYDFLAGDDRYKRSLATGAAALHWLTLGP